MKISVSLATIKQTRLREFAWRFIFGGLVTAAAGFIANEFGPVIGGLFLAFPSIFPASMTLVQKHEMEKKERYSMSGKRQGVRAAGASAAGAALGTFGLLIFGLVVFLYAPEHNAWLVLGCATVAWCIVSTLAWIIRKRV